MQTLTDFGLKAGDEVRVVADKELVISPNAPQDIGAQKVPIPEVVRGS